MKIERKEPEFQTITITIETQDELDQLAAMAYYCNFDNSVGGKDIAIAIYRAISGQVLTKYRASYTDPFELEIVK